MAVGVALALWSLAGLGLQLWRVHADGGVFAGSDGPFAADQLQYLAWVREASEHGLVADRYDLASSHAAFLHPMLALSGAGVAAGLSVQFAYLLWKPVAVAVLFAGTLAYVRRNVPPGGHARTAALALALFFFTPFAPLWKWAHIDAGADWSAIAGVAGEVFPAGSLWGYLPTAIAVGLMAWFFTLVPRMLEAGDWLRSGAVAAGAGLAISWLHPWQGITAVLVLAVLAPWSARRARLLVPAAATAAPLAYYAGLAHWDRAWDIAERQNEVPHAPAAALVLALAPALLLARSRLRSRTADEIILGAWPLATLVNYVLISQSVPLHALEGLSIPLAVLGVRAGLRRGVGAAIVLALTVPGMVLAFTSLRDSTRGHAQAFVLRDAEADALRTLPRDGGVFTSAYLGAAVPVFTSRKTWVGHPSWTPSFTQRALVAEDVLAGRTHDAGRVVRATGARFVVADCDHRRDLRPLLKPAGVTRVGCATVYDLGP